MTEKALLRDVTTAATARKVELETRRNLAQKLAAASPDTEAGRTMRNHYESTVAELSQALALVDAELAAVAETKRAHPELDGPEEVAQPQPDKGKSP